MDETIYVILKLLFDFALEVWFSIWHQGEETRTETIQPTCTHQQQITLLGTLTLILPPRKSTKNKVILILLHAGFCCHLLTFSKLTFSKLTFFQIILSGTLSKCQTVWIQIRIWSGSKLFANVISKTEFKRKTNVHNKDLKFTANTTISQPYMENASTVSVM